jgi:hypothetical protein
MKVGGCQASIADFEKNELPIFGCILEHIYQLTG